MGATPSLAPAAGARERVGTVRDQGRRDGILAAAISSAAGATGRTVAVRYARSSPDEWDIAAFDCTSDVRRRCFYVHTIHFFTASPDFVNGRGT